MIVSIAQQKDSAIDTHVSILPQMPLPSRLPHNTEESSLLWITLLIIHLKYNSMYMAVSNSLTIQFRGWIVDCKSHVLWAEQNTRGKRMKNAVSKIIPIYLNVNYDHTFCLV